MKKNRLKKPAIFVVLLLINGCVQGDTSVRDEAIGLCGEKPNCVSTLDPRPNFHLAPFELVSEDISISRILEIALTLPGARLRSENATSFQIECVSTIMRFIDDLDVRIEGKNLMVRSVSRLGYSDFGVNRKRAEQLRMKLQEQGLIL